VSLAGYAPKTTAVIVIGTGVKPTAWTAIPAGEGAGTSTFGTSTINAITFGKDKFVAVGNEGKVAYSANGIAWTVGTTYYNLGTNNILCIAYDGNSKFFIGARRNIMQSSSDGISFVADYGGFPMTIDVNIGDTINAIAFGNGIGVDGGSVGRMAYLAANSTTGFTNEGVVKPFGTDVIILSIAYGNNKFVAVGTGGIMVTSTDGKTWTSVTNSTFGTDGIQVISFVNNKFVAGGPNGKMATSPDGVTWTAVTNSTFGTDSISAIAYGNGTFVAGGSNGKMATSTDGVTWTAVTDSTFGTSGIYGIAYGNNRFVAVGYNGKMAFSSGD